MLFHFMRTKYEGQPEALTGALVSLWHNSKLVNSKLVEILNEAEAVLLIICTWKNSMCHGYD